MAEKQAREQEGYDLDALRHSTSHVMAEAVLSMFPEAKLGIGPPIEDRFYYDFDLGRKEDGSLITFTREDLAEIESRMRESIEAHKPFVRREISREGAEEILADQPYKLELIGDMGKGEVISTYSHDGFTDLCKGPHMDNTGQINPDAFKLLSIAGAYWRGDEQRPMLQRIYGTVWSTQEELEAYLQKLKEIEKREQVIGEITIANRILKKRVDGSI